LRSIRSSARARTSERGFALISALILSVLYFGLMELMLIDSQRALAEAQRFRARVVATTLAESAAELAAEQIVNHGGMPIDESDAQGTMRGMVTYSAGTGGGESFTLTGIGTTGGITRATASVFLAGEIQPPSGQPAHISITTSLHK
jgi:Tfp pilus assembly protein PilX